MAHIRSQGSSGGRVGDLRDYGRGSGAPSRAALRPAYGGYVILVGLRWSGVPGKNQGEHGDDLCS